MPSPFQAALRPKRRFTPATQQTIADAEMMGERDAGGRNNRFGGNIGRIGESPIPLPPTGQYAAGQGLSRLRAQSGLGTGLIRLPDGGMRTGPQIGAGLPTADAMRAQSAVDLANRQSGLRDSLAQQKADGHGLYEPMRTFRRRIDARPSQSAGYDPATVGLHRARAGMRLSPEEQTQVAQMAMTVPGGLTSLLSGSRSERKANSQALLRERGIAHGDARAAARNYQAMTAPQNVRNALGQTITRPGMPPLAAMLGGGGGQQLRNVLLYGQQGAGRLAEAKIDAGGRQQQLDPAVAMVLDNLNQNEAFQKLTPDQQRKMADDVIAHRPVSFPTVEQPEELEDGPSWWDMGTTSPKNIGTMISNWWNAPQLVDRAKRPKRPRLLSGETPQLNIPHPGERY